MSTNGKTNFLGVSEEAGISAAKDVALFVASSNSTAAAPAIGAAGIAAAATIASAIGTAGIFGVGVANAVLSNSEKGELEMSFSNNSSQPVVAYDYDTENCDISNVPQPLAPGESDVLVITRPEAFDSTTKFVVRLMVGGAGSTECISCTLNFYYTTDTDPGRWCLDATVDGDPGKFDQKVQLLGVTFLGNPDFPKFSFYVGTTETANGALSVTFYDFAG